MEGNGRKGKKDLAGEHSIISIMIKLTSNAIPAS